MSRMRLHYRIGDGDSYHSCDDVHDLAEALHEAGVTLDPDDGLTRYYGSVGKGIQAPGYMGTNMISVYWGKTVEDADAELSVPELSELQTLLRELNEPD